MSNKLNRDEILREMLDTLVKGWGRKAVYEALDELAGTKKSVRLGSDSSDDRTLVETRAVQLVEDLSIAADRKNVMLELAAEFDAGNAFPSTADVKAFLASHQLDVKEIRSRHQAFRRMIPILLRMSDKGLFSIISKAHQTGPAKLTFISDAIKDVGYKRRNNFGENKTELSKEFENNKPTNEKPKDKN